MLFCCSPDFFVPFVYRLVRSIRTYSTVPTRYMYVYISFMTIIIILMECTSNAAETALEHCNETLST